MNDGTEYEPPEFWTREPGENGGRFAGVNRPTAGAQFERDCPCSGFAGSRKESEAASRHTAGRWWEVLIYLT